MVVQDINDLESLCPPLRIGYSRNTPIPNRYIDWGITNTFTITNCDMRSTWVFSSELKVCELNPMNCYLVRHMKTHTDEKTYKCSQCIYSIFPWLSYINIIPSGRKQIALIVKMYSYPFRCCFHHGSRGQLCLHLDFKVKIVKKI